MIITCPDVVGTYILIIRWYNILYPIKYNKISKDGYFFFNKIIKSRYEFYAYVEVYLKNLHSIILGRVMH